MDKKIILKLFSSSCSIVAILTLVGIARCDDISKDVDVLTDIKNRAVSSLNWKIVNPRYPTNDVIVAAKVITPDMLPNNPANQDCSVAFNKALTQVGSAGGGVVYAPEGQYLFTRPLKLPHNVILRGAWKNVSRYDKTVKGTILKVKYRGLATNNAPAFIQLNSRSGLKDLSIWYPDQRVTKIIPYTRTIDGATDKPDELIIENVNLVNSYIGIYIRGNAKRPFYRGLYGSPLKLGMYQFRSSSVPTYIQVHFSAKYWAGSKLPGAPTEDELKAYLKRYATAIKVGGSDNIFASEWHISDYRIGLHFIKNSGGDINGNMYGLYVTNCKIALLGDSVGPSFIINSVFEGSVLAVLLKNLSPTGIFFNNCSFSSSSLKTFICTNTRVTSHLKFQECHFDGKLQVKKAYVNLISSMFLNDKVIPIQLSSMTKSLLLVNTDFMYIGNPVQLNGMNPNKLKQETDNIFSKTFISFDVEGCNNIRKPYKENLIVMGQEGYSVHVDGITNDAYTIQRALNKISSLGGGIVLLPKISENGYAIRSPLNVPEGVELRSTSEGLHSFNGWNEKVPSALLQIYHGREGNAPTITLSKGSGFKGFTIHYPKQFMNNLVPYATTVKAIGDNVYIANNQFINSYSHVELNESDNHLVENNMTQHTNNVFKIINCENGRFNHNFCRDEWGDSRLNTVEDLDILKKYTLKHNIVYEVVDSINQQFFASFARVSNKLAVFKNSSVHALQFSMESCANGIDINRIPQGRSVELIGSSLRTDQYVDNATSTTFKVFTKSSDGDFRVYSTLCSGNPDSIFNIDNTDVLFQNSYVRLDGKSSTVKLKGVDGGVVRIENCAIWRYPITASIQNFAGNRLEIVGNHFLKGMRYIYSPETIKNTVNPFELSGSIRLAFTTNWRLVLILKN